MKNTIILITFVDELKQKCELCVYNLPLLNVSNLHRANINPLSNRVKEQNIFGEKRKVLKSNRLLPFNLKNQEVTQDLTNTVHKVPNRR